MAKQIINIGITENDNLGEAIRSAFQKVNNNFDELYTLFDNESGTLIFSSLGDGPDSYDSNQLFTANSLANKVLARTLQVGPGLLLDITNDNITLSSDGGTSPLLKTFMNASGFTIANVADPSQFVVDTFNQLYPDTPITIDDILISKGYADNRYILSSSNNSTTGFVRSGSSGNDQWQIFPNGAAIAWGYVESLPTPWEIQYPIHNDSVTPLIMVNAHGVTSSLKLFSITDINTTAFSVREYTKTISNTWNLSTTTTVNWKVAWPEGTF